MRRIHQPEPMSDDTGSSYARGSSKPGPSTSTQCQLYDHEGDDPVRFANGRKPAPTPKSAGGHLSYASSDAPSFTSASFTFSSSTDGSSAPSSIFAGSRSRDEPKPNDSLSSKLKEIQRRRAPLVSRVHRLLEKLHAAAQTSKLALEHLQSFINYAYTYYTDLHEHPFLNSFKSHWLESLGSLARHRLAVLTLFA
ncbi:hypothetical protein OF83DRAFT_1172791 [Amylostereum chailletii]|nr:hypothetical protein OF83DRAFT_1172791 [Amylostereum chailletii]